MLGRYSGFIYSSSSGQAIPENRGQDKTTKCTLIKATLIHGSKRLKYRYEAQNRKGLYDFEQGWGMINLKESINYDNSRKVKYIDYKKGLNTGESVSFEVDVQNLGVPFKVTLAWTDFPGPASIALRKAVNKTVDAGIVVLVAAGNSGRLADSTIGSPGEAEKVITVGAVNNQNEIGIFSSRGPVKVDPNPNSPLNDKPDVVAPGVNIIEPVV